MGYKRMKCKIGISLQAKGYELESGHLDNVLSIQCSVKEDGNVLADVCDRNKGAERRKTTLRFRTQMSECGRNVDEGLLVTRESVSPEVMPSSLMSSILPL